MSEPHQVSIFKPHSHLPVEDSGRYTDHNPGVSNAINSVTDLVIRAADRIPLPKGSENTPIVLCDYATADGGTSLLIIDKLIGFLKGKYGDKQCIQVVYEDQSSNDFNALFANIYGSDSYIYKHKNVYVSACATNFYSQCLPPHTLHPGFSSTAMHYLFDRPCNLTDAVQQSLSTVEAERQCFAQQAARDWESILFHRAKEMVDGGQFIIMCSSVDNEGQFLGQTKRVKVSMFQELTNIWKDMVKDCKITQEEFNNTTFNTYYRDESELSAPFKNPQSSVYKAGLRLVSMETKVTPCPYQVEWLSSGHGPDNKAEARAHAKKFLPTVRNWTHGVFRGGLLADRSEEEKKRLTDEFYQRYEDSVASQPENHAMDTVHTVLHIEKVHAQQL